MNRSATILTAFLPLAVLAAAPREKLGFSPSNELERATSIYIAPENQFLFRMRNPDGSYREFQRTFERPNLLWGVRGWRGTIKGSRLTIRSGNEVEGGPAKYVFEQGRLVSFAQGAYKRDFPAASERPPTAGGAPYVFGVGSDGAVATGGGSGKVKAAKRGAKGPSKQVLNELHKKWAKSGRLRWPFENPNENGYFYLSLAFLSMTLFLLKARVAKIVGGVLFLGASFALVMTASRGGFLAFALGLVPTLALNFKRLRQSRAVWILSALLLLGGIGWFATHGSRLLTRGFTGKSKWSNESRIEMWTTAPKMMAEAPGGWEAMHVGRAYFDWYQDLDEISLTGSLINDHLTRLVGYGHFGRFAYLWLWLAALAVTGYSALRTRRAVAVGMVIAAGVAGWFNPVLDNILLRIVPLAIGVIFLATRPWRNWRFRPMALLLGGVTVLALGAQLALYAVGGTPKRGYPVRVEGGRVYVKGANPQIWIADDGKALGGVMACKDLRGYYVYDPHAPAVGYVRDVKNLPTNVRRLVLAGDAGDAWLRMMAEGGAAKAGAIPKEVIFISPPFPPSALPEGLLKSCRVRLVIGEFTARYEPEYLRPPSWVTVVPAMELYLTGWMRYVVAE